MTCESFREAMSARIDGEAADLPDLFIDDHLGACAACREWVAVADDLVLAARAGGARPVPDLSAAILARVPRPRSAADRSKRPVRWALAAIAVTELVLTVPSLVFGGHPGGHVHMAHEVGSWDVALAVGFLVAALRPARAWGMLPLVAAIVGCLLVTTGLDVADGNVVHPRMTSHALQVAGLAALWMLASRPMMRRSPLLQTA